MIVMVNQKQVEVDEQTTVAALLESPAPGHRGGNRLLCAAAFGLDDKAFRRCTTRGGDGGAGWLIPN
jgi:hypothetical protein